MKSKEEISALKKETEPLNKKLAELSEEELTQAAGGMSQEEFQNLQVGNRVQAIMGRHVNKCGTVIDIIDVRPGLHVCAEVLFDDGTNDGLSFNAIIRI